MDAFRKTDSVSCPVKQTAVDINDLANVSVGFINVHLNGCQALKG